jgi:hypothetical protein
MDHLTSMLGFLAALSVATERITEMLKGLSGFLTGPGDDPKMAKDPKVERLRKLSIQFLAVAIGSVLSYLTYGQLQKTLGLDGVTPAVCLLFGAMASGGSGLWNSAPDIAREMNRQKQMISDKLKAA